MKITIEKFIEIMKLDLQKFNNFYMNSRKEDKTRENWPLEMNEADWFEQFLIYINSNDY